MMVGVLILIAGMLAVIAYEISRINPTVNVCEVKPEKKTKEKVEKKVEKKPKRKPQAVDISQKPTLYGEKWMKVEDDKLLPIYEVSNFGRVLNIESGKLLRQNIYENNRGVVVSLKNKKNAYVMREVKVLVAKAFIGEQSVYSYTVVNIDGDPMNNNASNLKWQKK